MNPKGQKVRVPRYRVHGMRQPPHADHENSHTKNTKAEPTNAMRRMDRMSFISTAFYVVDPNETIDTTPPIHRTHHWWFPGQHKPDRIKVSLRCGHTPGSGASSPTLDANNLPRPCQSSDRRPWSCSCCGRSWRVQWCTTLALFLMGLNEANEDGR